MDLFTKYYASAHSTLVAMQINLLYVAADAAICLLCAVHCVVVAALENETFLGMFISLINGSSNNKNNNNNTKFV